MNFKTFFKQKTVKFFIIVFASLLVISNIVIFTISKIQYNREYDRQITTYETMMVHLITMEDIDTAITYTTHYYHTQGIKIAVYDAQEQLLYVTDDAPRDLDLLPIYNADENIIAYIVFDDQNSHLGNELSIGLIIINSFSVIVFLIFLRLLYWYINASYHLLEEDLNMIGLKDESFNFTDLEDVSIRLKHLINSEKLLRDNQKEYVKVLAHDIKTPLTVLKAYLEGIQLGKIDFSKEVNIDMLEEISQIEKMIPKFMMENPEYKAIQQNIKPILEHLIDRLQLTFTRKQIKVNQTVDDVFLTISKVDLNRLLENILVNAYHYSDHNSQIDIELNQKHLMIKDYGIGMDNETLEHIKKGPYRSKAAFEHYQTGSGMGMQIVFEIIDRLGYSINIESKVNSGTKIEIIF